MTVREVDGTRVKIGPIEVFDGTPVVDIKSASTRGVKVGRSATYISILCASRLVRRSV